jgi:hypothetical protein
METVRSKELVHDLDHAARHDRRPSQQHPRIPGLYIVRDCVCREQGKQSNRTTLIAMCGSGTRTLEAKYTEVFRVHTSLNLLAAPTATTVDNLNYRRGNVCGNVYLFIYTISL